MHYRNGFSLPIFCLGLAALALSLFQLLALLGSNNLRQWIRYDEVKAENIYRTKVPKPFLKLPDYLDAHIALARRLGPLSELNEAYQDQLAWMPANAHAWSRYAVGLQRFGQTDAQLEQVVQQSLKLAPNSKSIALEQSIIAAYNWSAASPELRQLWAQSFKTALQRPRELAYLANAGGVSNALCQHLTKPHPLEQWCLQLPAYQKACRSGKLTEDQQKWCGSVGISSQ